MNIQIMGTLKCRETQKAQRYFKERRIQTHFRDLLEKGLSEGELDNILRKYSEEDLLDKESKQFAKRHMDHMVFNIREELLSDPLLIKTPVVRNGKETTIGFQPDIWKLWIAQA